jgi:uncharacterized protein with von Willebrand factor type A (vWA) domain
VAPALVANLLTFGRVLRASGLPVHHGRLLDAVQALEWVGVASRADVRATLRALLVHRQEDLARFDEAFALFFRDHTDPAPGPPLFSLGERPRVVVRTPPAAPVAIDIEDIQSEAAPGRRAVAAWSPVGVSRTKDFGEFSAEEFERARVILEDLPWQLGVRTTRRWTRAADGPIDLRRVLRHSTRRGDFLELPRRERRVAARPIVVIGDVSGSMERYSRMLLHFAYGLARSGVRVETFVFATQLTRLTRQFGASRQPRRDAGARDPRAGAARLVRDVQDWGGGTRIGEALRTFNTRWARRVMRNGPVVIIVSDGWDRGDPELVAREASRLRRSCHRLVWLNPLLGSPSYEPLTRGMQAALRYVDDFRPAHNLASLEELARHLRMLPPRTRPVGLTRTRGR